MAANAEPLDIPETDASRDDPVRYQVVSSELDVPVLFLDILDTGYAAKWDTEQDFDSFTETVEEMYTEPEHLRINAMFHSETNGPGEELNSVYAALWEQENALEDCTSLKITYGPHEAIWMEESDEMTSIVYSTGANDLASLDRYYRLTSGLAEDDADNVLEEVHTRVEQDLGGSPYSGIEYGDFDTA